MCELERIREHSWILGNEEPLPLERAAVAVGSKILQKFRTVPPCAANQQRLREVAVKSHFRLLYCDSLSQHRHRVLARKIPDVHPQHQSEAPHFVHLAKQFELPLMT